LIPTRIQLWKKKSFGNFRPSKVKHVRLKTILGLGGGFDIGWVCHKGMAAALGVLHGFGIALLNGEEICGPSARSMGGAVPAVEKQGRARGTSHPPRHLLGLSLCHPTLPAAALGALTMPGRWSRSAQKLWFHYEN